MAEIAPCSSSSNNMTMFSKQLTESDVEKSLLIPSRSLDAQIPVEEGHFFYMNVIDNAGTAWTFPCFVQHSSEDESSKGKASSVISVGWLQFLRNRDVRAGDMVFIHHKYSSDDIICIGKKTADFRIEVKRKIRMLGQDIWAAL